MASIFSKQKRPTLMSQALQEIREAIRKGKLKPGHRLVEIQLTEDDKIPKNVSAMVNARNKCGKYPISGH